MEDRSGCYATDPSLQRCLDSITMAIHNADNESGLYDALIAWLPWPVKVYTTPL